MDERAALTERFEEDRPRLRAVAYRMLGSASEADDAVQEAWLRLDRSDTSDVENLPAWLTTVVARVCLNMLRARASRREDPLDAEVPLNAQPFDSIVRQEDGDPEEEALLADSVGLALLVVLDTLSPAERLAFVLHDMFAVPFDEIGRMTERTPAAARQLASRARRRVRGAPHSATDSRAGGTGGTTTGDTTGGTAEGSTGNITRGKGEGSTGGTAAAPARRIVDAFLAASRAGDFDALVALLAPDVVLRADRAAGPIPGPLLIRGARTVARGAMAATGRARFAGPALVNGAPGLVMAPRGRLFLAIGFTITGTVITEIDIIADRDRLDRLELGVLDDQQP